MSSRNARLAPAERALAPVIHRALSAAAAAYSRGERRSAVLVAAASDVLASCDALRVEYLEIVDPDVTAAIDVADDESVLAIAAWLGPVRLIDNVTLAEPAAPVLERSSTGVAMANGHGGAAAN